MFRVVRSLLYRNSANCAVSCARWARRVFRWKDRKNFG